MAVQAQYPSNILLLNRNEQDGKNMILGDTNNYSLQQKSGFGVGVGVGVGGGFLDQSHMFFNNNNNINGAYGVGVNPRKRSREISTTPTTTNNISFNFSLQSNQTHQNHQFIDLTQLQNHQKNPSIVSTGLKLSFQDQNHQQQFQDKLAFQFKQQNDELDHFLNVQGEQLRHMLAEKTQRHYRALLDKAEEAVTRRLREKEVEVQIAARQNAELHARAAQISAEAQAWQAKAQDQEAQAMSLQAQIQQAIIRPNTTCGPLLQDTCGSGPQCPGDTEDAESVNIDPVNEKRANLSSCKACCTSAASVVLLPCRHLCVCVQCDKRVQACPVCYSLRSASVEVYFT